mmetsp:Transcript_10457/g.18223  ORF Transcript_10457/g.18223 Transcript_10457/m.18223 type:complete len:90 (+) Transcript_10457:715-984(+)
MGGQNTSGNGDLAFFGTMGAGLHWLHDCFSGADSNSCLGGILVRGHSTERKACARIERLKFSDVFVFGYTGCSSGQQAVTVAPILSKTA